MYVGIVYDTWHGTAEAGDPIDVTLFRTPVVPRISP